MTRFAVCGTLAAALLASTSAQAEVDHITIGIQNGVGYLPIQVMGAQHLVEKHAKKIGVNLTADVRNLGSAGLVRDALIAGQIQFGVAGPPTLVTMHDKTGGDIKAVGAVVSVPIYLNTTNAKVKGICDFTDGDKIALPTVKSSVQAVTLQMATKYKCSGDPFRNDRFTVSMTHPDGYNALMSGMVSTHMTSPPFSYNEIEQGKGKVRRILNSYDIFHAKSTLVLLIASDQFRTANPKVYQAVRDALEEGEAYVRAHPKEAAQIYMKAEKTKEPEADIIKQISSPDIVYSTTPVAVGRYASFMYEIGTVKTRYTWQDLSMPDLRARKGLVTNTAPTPLLKVDGATIQYETDAAVVVAVWRVSFTVQRGERLMILGRSGCGKSTLLKAIGGYLIPVEGSITLEGQPVSRPGPDRMIVWQDTDQLLPWKTVRENVLYPMRLNGIPAKEARERADNFIAMVDLNRAADQYPHQLSGGMKMRVAVARGLAMKPAILLMDEPFAALDALTRQRMQEELLRLQQETGATVVFVTHDIAEAAALGTRVIVMSPFPGQIKANLDVTRFASRDELAKTISDVIHDDDDDKSEAAA